MPYPLQRQDAADWIADQSNSARRLFTDANSGPATRPATGMYPARVSDWLATTSGTFETIWLGRLTVDAPILDIGGQVVTESGTTGEVRVMVSVDQFGPTVAIPAFTADFWSPPPAEHGVTVETMTVTVQARRTSGAGLVRVGMEYCRLLAV
jgi:hypothetical protein